jgi:hypothetical protein
MNNAKRQFLVVIEGPNEGETFPLPNAICTIGRTTDNTIVIDSTRISRHHTQIRFTEGTTGTEAVIEDMGSTNGTWVNSRPIAGPSPLKPGDRIMLADYITFRYEVSLSSATEKVIPPMPGSATRVIDDSASYTPPPPPPPPDYEEAYSPYRESSSPPSQQPFIQIGSTPQPAPAARPTPAPQPEWAARPVAPPAKPPAKRAKWVYFLIALLLILICVCLGIAIYLWFAPVTFWESVFELFNAPFP